MGSEGEGVNDGILFAVLQLKQLVAGLAPWRPRFIFMALHMGFSPHMHTLVFHCLYLPPVLHFHISTSHKKYIILMIDSLVQ
jgi:hypothetical protein